VNPATYTVETAGFTLNNPERKAYTFDGWTGSNGTVKQKEVTVKEGSTGNLTYTANWTGNVYTVTFDGNGGYAAEKTVKTAAGGKLKTLPAASGSDAFNGWFTSPTGGTQVTTSYVFGEDAVVYAQWSPIYTVTFNANGGSVSVREANTGSGSKLSSLPTPTKSGYVFDGWYTSANGGSKITSSTVITEDMDVYAHWKEAVGVTESDREIPSGSVVLEDAAIAPVAERSRGVTVGPSPVSVGGTVTLYRNGGKAVSGKLSVFDALGQRVGSVDVSGTNKIGTWKVVGVTEGTYLIKGVLTEKNGAKVSVTLPVSVVR